MDAYVVEKRGTKEAGHMTDIANMSESGDTASPE
jgi:hypothetical protein